jgi:hypothetical protein
MDKTILLAKGTAAPVKITPDIPDLMMHLDHVAVACFWRIARLFQT